MGKEDLKKLLDKLTDSEKKKIKNENKAKVVFCLPLASADCIAHAPSRACNAMPCLFAGILLVPEGNLRACLAAMCTRSHL